MRWVTLRVATSFEAANSLREKLILTHPKEFVSGKSIKIKLRSDGYHLKVAPELLSEKIRAEMKIKL